jgi:hypothetical protein
MMRAAMPRFAAINTLSRMGANAAAMAEDKVAQGLISHSTDIKLAIGLCEGVVAVDIHYIPCSFLRQSPNFGHRFRRAITV